MNAKIIEDTWKRPVTVYRTDTYFIVDEKDIPVAMINSCTIKLADGYKLKQSHWVQHSKTPMPMPIEENT